MATPITLSIWGGGLGGWCWYRKMMPPIPSGVWYLHPRWVRCHNQLVCVMAIENVRCEYISRAPSCQPLDLYGLFRRKIVGAQRLASEADGRATVLEVMTEDKEVR